MNAQPVTPPALPAIARRGRPVLAWVVIAGVVGLIAAVTFLEKGKSGKPAADAMGLMQEIWLSQSTVAQGELMRNSFGTTQPAALRALAQPVVDRAESPAQRLRAAIVATDLGATDLAAQTLQIPAGEKVSEALEKDIEQFRAYLADPNSAPLPPEFFERHVWFGRLAEAIGKPATDPGRAAVLAEAQRTWVRMVIVGVVMITVVLASLFCCVTLIVLFIFRVTRFLPTPRTADAALLVEGFAVYLGLIGAGLIAGRLDLPIPSPVLLVVSLGSVAAGLLWPLWRGMRQADWREAIGLHLGRGFFREASLGVVGYLGGLPIVAVGFGLTLLATRLSGADASHPIVFELSGSLPKVVVLVLLAVVYAPISEEIMFRGALFQNLRQSIPWLAAAALTGLIFAAIHPQGWAGIFVLMSIGGVFAIIRQWRGSLVGPIIAHALNNGTVLALALMLLR